MTGKRVLVIGLDAFDRTVGDELIAAGRLPRLGELVAHGHQADVENPFGLLTGPVWPTLMTGVGPGRHANYSWRPLQPGTYRKRYMGPNSPTHFPSLWQQLSRRGVSCLVVDVPRFQLQPDVNGCHVVAFRQHDARDRSEFGAWPPAVGEEILDRYDLFEDHCDRNRLDGTLDLLHSQLVAGIDQKIDFLDRQRAEGRADLSIVVFPEAHCAGHQWFDDRDRLEDVYCRLDDAVGQLIDRCSDESTSLVVLMSHGMGVVRPVSRLLPPVLDAIDDTMGRAGLGVQTRAFLERVPNRTARAALRLARRDIEHLDHWVDSSRRFFRISVFPTHGAIRLNLEGREPRGVVRVSERTEVLNRLEAELLALRDIDTGEQLITEVEPMSDHHRSPTDVGFPDVIFEWEVSDRIVRGARSETLGSIMVPPEQYRPGNHFRDGRAVLAGPGIPSGRSTMRAEDVAPTIAALIGHDLDDVDGAALPALFASGVQAGPLVLDP